ncbi:hypothetical protein CCH79_00018826, partial [Gambusia affinis]
VSTVATAEESSCVPGFQSKLLILNVTQKHLRHGTILGKVGFTDCTGHTRFLFSSDDDRFLVRTDGMLMVKRRVILHEGNQRFSIHSLTARGQQLTLPVMVLYRRIHHRDNEPLDHTEMSSTNNTKDKSFFDIVLLTHLPPTRALELWVRIALQLMLLVYCDLPRPPVGTGIIVRLKPDIEKGNYKVAMSVSDNQGLSQVSTVAAKVCDCTGPPICKDGTRTAAGSSPWVIGGVLLLVLVGTVIALTMYLKKTRGSKDRVKGNEKSEDDDRDELIICNEEGGGESIQQSYSESVLHFALTNKSDMPRIVMAAPLGSGPSYKPRPTNPDELGDFIAHNLKVADTDLTAPPYDSLLVFDLEGGSSEAEQLSSLCSSSDGEQDYDSIREYGPRFKKLADMCGGGDDDMMQFLGGGPLQADIHILGLANQNRLPYSQTPAG